MNITFENVTQVYSGQQGCMCGCKGTYRDSERSKKVMLTRILKQDYEVQFFPRVHDDGVAGCLFYDDNNTGRTQAVYFNVNTPFFA